MTRTALRPSLRASALVIALVGALAGANLQTATAAPPTSGSTGMLSVAADGVTPGDEASTDVSISADGRYVAFSSWASNLTSIPNGGHRQVYVADTQTGAVELVSRAAGPTPAAGDAESLEPAISADGRYVAFTSGARNLGPALDPMNDSAQVYVRDLRPGGITRLVSVSLDDSMGGSKSSGASAISADGSVIAFDSAATDLVAGVSPPGFQVYVAKFGTAKLPAIAVASLQDSSRSPVPDLANENAFAPSISADGRQVAFSSAASNLQSIPVTGGHENGFVHDMVTGSTRLITRSVDGRQEADETSSQFFVSADGSHVVFASLASNLTRDRTGLGSAEQIYLHDLGAGTTTLVSVGADGQPATDDTWEPSVSGDGRYVAYASRDRVARVDSAGQVQVYVRDGLLATSTLVSSRHDDGRRGGASDSGGPALTPDGRFVAFTSKSEGLVTSGPAPSAHQVFLRALPGARVDRVGGADRYDVSSGVAADAFPPGTPVAYIATGKTYADALSGSAAAVVKGGPVLLVSRDAVPASVDAQLRRLKPGAIVILGGEVSVSAGVATTLKSYSTTVTRLGGADRYEVSAAVSAATFGLRPEVAYVASGEVFPDALSGSAAAGAAGAPVLLVRREAVPEVVRLELVRLAPKRIVLLGGENTISAATADKLGTIAPLSRITGADRYEVSAGLSSQTSAARRPVVYVASGAVFPDALSGSAAAGADEAPVLLVKADSIPPAVAAELTRLKPFRIVVLGGPATIAPALVSELQHFVVP